MAEIQIGVWIIVWVAMAVLSSVVLVATVVPQGRLVRK